ncbi:MAG: hypothetical protein ACE5ER_08685 [Nitrospinaceae bacterium]
MTETAKVKILKLLELTMSDNDAEALNAIRKANNIREKSQLQWVEVFSGAAPASALPPVFQRRPPPPKPVTVETMLDEILKRPLSDLLQARIEELRYLYGLTGQLSGEECNLLINTYNHNCF